MCIYYRNSRFPVGGGGCYTHSIQKPIITMLCGGDAFEVNTPDENVECNSVREADRRFVIKSHR